MKIIRLFIIIIGGASILSADSLADLTKLARQLNEIRLENQRIKDTWDREKKAIEIQETILKKQLKQGDANIRRETAQTSKLEDQIRQQKNSCKILKGKLDRYQQCVNQQMKQLAQDMAVWPPFLIRKCQEQMTDIRNLQRTPNTLPQQLQLIQKMHDEIRQAAKSLNTSVEELPSLHAQFRVAYLGCSWALALAPNGSRAAFGWPSEAGWAWKESPRHLPEIRRFFLMVDRQAPAELVNLPLKCTTTQP